MTASTTIRCTKSDFRDALIAEYVAPAWPDEAVPDELIEVINGLVRQAEQHRGTFAGHNAYLDCDFTVTPDAYDAPKADLAAERMAGGGQLNNVHPGLLPRTPAPVKTMADYRPGAAVAEQIHYAARVCAGRLPEWRTAILSVVRVGVDLETAEQDIEIDRDTIMTWLGEQIDALNAM